ncbi:hypothetical protein VTL71DRAFT_327 [Oculimacula yallundae]|uniref:Uncharacterized protein n=1 Tax=Oculimacula yallundae TaxID=86028 RepID=A0ABR4CZS6_9HELO
MSCKTHDTQSCSLNVVTVVEIYVRCTKNREDDLDASSQQHGISGVYSAGKQGEPSTDSGRYQEQIIIQQHGHKRWETEEKKQGCRKLKDLNR